jgi:hypothetical protein
MNGRVYDYNVGRFMSVDPFIHEGSQGINPYSYIMNNPLAGTDPTGYEPENEVEEPETFEFTAGDVESIHVNSEGQVTVNFNNGAESQSFQADSVSVGGNTVDIGNQSEIASNNPGASPSEALSAIGGAIADNWKGIVKGAVGAAADSNPVMGAASAFVGAEEATDAVIDASEGNYEGAIENAGLVLVSKLRVADKAVKFGQSDVAKTFSNGKFKGKTIGEVSEGLKNGSISPNDLPLDYIVRNGDRVTLNNRSLTALRRAGVNPTKLINRTGSKMHERALNRHLSGAEPSDVIRIRGAGKNASSIE